MIHHRVNRADCAQPHCGAVHLDEGPDPLQPFRAMIALAEIQHPTIWTTRDRRTVRIIDMDDRHLANSILMMRQHPEAVIQKYRRLALSVPFPMFDGDMAQLHAEQEYEDLVEQMWSCDSLGKVPIFRALVVEHTRRLIQRHHPSVPPIPAGATW